MVVKLQYIWIGMFSYWFRIKSILCDTTQLYVHATYFSSNK